MSILIAVLLVANLAVLSVLLHHMLKVRQREQDLADAVTKLVPEDALPEQLEAAFVAGRKRLMVVEILNPLELAASQVKVAGAAGALAPGMIRKVVYEQAVKITEEELAKQGVEADVQIYVAG